MTVFSKNQNVFICVCVAYYTSPTQLANPRFLGLGSKTMGNENSTSSTTS